MKNLLRGLILAAIVTGGLLVGTGCHIQNWECGDRILCDDDGCYACDDIDCDLMTCWDDSDCPDGYKCGDEDACEPVASSDDPDPTPTGCQTDFDCAWGVICIDGVCVHEEPVNDPPSDDPPSDDPCPTDCEEPPVTEPGECIYNDDCGAEGLCVNGECLFSCVADDECDGTEICLSGLCLPAPVCQAKADCPDGYDCVNGLCDVFELPGDEDPPAEDPCK